MFATVRSRALAGNLLGDSADRSVIVYLPPSYAVEPTRQYPVLYLLHGNTQRNTVWVDGTFQGLTILDAMDSGISAGAVREMVIVMPDAYNRYGGAHYVNSPVIGNWADFVTRDLVNFADRTYRTLPSAASRGLAGFSRGGNGALRLALEFPDIYGAVYSMSGVTGYFDNREYFDNTPFYREDWERVLAAENPAQAAERLPGLVGFAAAYSPNPNRPPLFVDFPFEVVNGKLQRVQSVWQKWHANDLEVLVASRGTNLRRLRALRIDCGRSDEIVTRARLLTNALTQSGIRHIYEEFDGGHGNRNRWRVETKLLPFFSAALAGQ
ncbi:MAG: alpha/beta hydrolase [Acidobacteriota bacterium]